MNTAHFLRTGKPLPDAPSSLFESSGAVPLEPAARVPPPERRSGLSLFWRTFFFLALLLIGSILAWLQTLHSLEFEPRAIQTAQQIASLVNLSRAALVYSDAIARVSLIKTMTDQEGVRIVPREPTDRFVPFDDSALSRRVTLELIRRLGPDTVVASAVNELPGFWVGFGIDGDAYWLQTDSNRFAPAGGKTWLIWLAVAAGLSLVGAALIARLINRPLRELSFAATRVQDGNFSASRLDENVSTSEIRDVNVGFNRMANRLAKVEQDRAVMLAGISHDLRTPLARLRLETELSVADLDAREHMAADISQLDAIIDKFLEYARPVQSPLDSVRLREIVGTCVYAVRDHRDIKFNLEIDDDLRVQGDAVELQRVFGNLIENARRYGKSPNTGIAVIDIAAVGRSKWVLIKVRDHGLGVSDEQLSRLTQPFFRGEAARTAANGAGLGLAIVERTVARMGGVFGLANTTSGGLAAHIRLQRSPRRANTGHLHA